MCKTPQHSHISAILAWYSPNYAEYLGMKYKEGREAVYHMIAPALDDVLPISEHEERRPHEEEHEEPVQEEDRKEKEANVIDQEKEHHSSNDKEL